VGSRQRALNAVASASVIDCCFSLPEIWRMTETKPSGETTAVQDYLKAIHELNVGGEAAATSLIAERLGVAAGSVTGMLKRLASRGLVEHVPYYGARLTGTGEAEAIRLIRRHRVLELFLVQVLGYGWDEVHEEAERLEHAVSDRLIERMSAVLGDPAEDPHGAPIPGVGVAFEDRQYPSLWDMDAGASGVLRRVPDEDPVALRYLAELDMRPGVGVEVGRRAPGNVPWRVRVGGDEHVVGAELSRAVQVGPMGQDGADGGRHSTAAARGAGVRGGARTAGVLAARGARGRRSHPRGDE